LIFYVGFETDEKQMTTTFDFTERHATFVKKYIEAYGEDFKKDFEEKSKMTPKQFQKKIDDGQYYDYIYRQISLKGVRITFQISVDYDDYDSDEEDDEEIERLPNMATLKPKIKVCHMTKDEFEVELAGFSTDCPENFGYTECDWADSLIKSYVICGCQHRVAEIKGFCKQCYVMTTKQEEACCCCYENEGVWIELECKHLIHYDCWTRIDFIKPKDGKNTYTKKCPLCRSEFCHGNYTRV
jgi:hypothetical protein